MEEEEFERRSGADDEGENEDPSGSRRETDDEDDEDDDSDEEEPKLKFDRLKNDFSNILDKDAVSCVAVHSKVRNPCLVVAFHDLSFLPVPLCRELSWSDLHSGSHGKQRHVQSTEIL